MQPRMFRVVYIPALYFGGTKTQRRLDERNLQSLVTHSREDGRPFEYGSRDTALAVGDELTRDHVAEFFKVKTV